MSRSSNEEHHQSRSTSSSRHRSVSFEPPAPSQRHTTSTNSSSDNVRSFCDSIAQMTGKLTKSLAVFGPWQAQGTATVVTQPHPMPTSTRFNRLQGLEKSYVESAEIPQTAPGMTVFYDSERDVQELTYFGANTCQEKKSKRGARNPWRAYGALRKLHEIGGNAPERMDKKHRKKSTVYTKIKRGTSPPNPPATPEIILNGTKDVAIMRNLHCPRGVPAEQLAQNVAIQMQTMAHEALFEMEPEISSEEFVKRKGSHKSRSKLKQNRE